MKIVKNYKGPTIEELDKRLEDAQLKLIQATNQHQPHPTSNGATWAKGKGSKN